MPVKELSQQCQKCHGHLYIWHEPENSDNPYMVACFDCGKVYYYGADAKEVAKWDEPGRVAATADTGITMQEAYQSNKTRTSCVACGQPTVQKAVLMSSIQYCSCVENLPT